MIYLHVAFATAVSLTLFVAMSNMMLHGVVAVLLP